MYKIKKWAETSYTTSEVETKRKLKNNRLELVSDPVFTGLEKLQRYVIGTILCKKKLWSISVDLLTPTDPTLKGTKQNRTFSLL